MRSLLLTAVIGMGILIIAGMILLVYGLIQKADNPDFKFFDLASEAPALEKALKEVEVPLAGKSSPAPAVSSAPVAFGDMRIEIPAGYNVVDTDMDAQRLVLRLKNDKGLTRLMILDINTGAKLGGLSLHPAQ